MRSLVVTMAAVLALPSASVLAQVQFIVPANVGQNLRVGEEFEYSLCLGQNVAIPGPGQFQGQINPGQSPCGTAANPSATVGGGNPPYYFVLDSGGFPPMGIVLDKNGVLRGTPRSTMASTFRVCAVDQSANQSCQQIRLQPQPANANANANQNAAPGGQARNGRGGANAAIIGGVLGGAVAIGVGAAVAAGGIGGDTTDKRRCAAGTTDCADGHCCKAGDGCCGIYGGSEVCCPGDYPHYCPSTNKCYRTFPSCDFSVCGGVVAGAPGAAVGAGPAVRALRRGDPGAKSEEAVPATVGCQVR